MESYQRQLNVWNENFVEEMGRYILVAFIK